MREPRGSGVRPTGMGSTRRPRHGGGRLGASVLALVVLSPVLAACGDGHGQPGSAVVRTSPSSPSSGATAGTRLRGDPVRTVDVPGTAAALTVTRQVAPRGGYQMRLYLSADGARTQLTDAQGNPVIPFVATDTSPTTLVGADCLPSGSDGPGDIAVIEARPQGTPDKATWRVTQTTYRLDGTAADPVRTRTLADGVTLPQVRRAWPDLGTARLFGHCG